ncbi:hypothetical protein CYMTET_55507 [Cymbomonas tetramitiformis]|uniref:Uncharacterized protein n=1 Tax=Cymbomonas tetramitiformis TaxID=36881 RepID=A0AAE0BD78_9CHLO|nr:hypothetical protein CYMTET_55507 [Cymbomonas tetramitiformis]
MKEDSMPSSHLVEVDYASSGKNYSSSAMELGFSPFTSVNLEGGPDDIGRADVDTNYHPFRIGSGFSAVGRNDSEDVDPFSNVDSWLSPPSREKFLSDLGGTKTKLETGTSSTLGSNLEFTVVDRDEDEARFLARLLGKE